MLPPILVILSLLAAAPPDAAPSDAVPPPAKADREKARKELVAKMALEVVTEYEVTQGKDPAKLVLQKEPILRWTQTEG